jgi:hypothetical protein
MILAPLRSAINDLSSNGAAARHPIDLSVHEEAKESEETE